MDELAVGATFADHVIRGVAGRGGMGIVYRALHVPLKREVALKVLAANISTDHEFRTRFRHEFEAAASIQHPNVIPIYHAGEQDGLLYVTMRYIDGTDLARLIAVETRLDPIRAAVITGQVAAALDAASRAGLVHRDVKPANVLIEAPGASERALLTDFGLTKFLHSDTKVTQAGTLVGTFDYTAPEQLNEQPVDARTDVYALGCVLFQALTGRVPFPRDTLAAKLFAHLESPPPSVTALVPEVPHALDAVIATALAKHPQDRYPSASDLARAALEAVDRPSLARGIQRLSIGERAPGWQFADTPLPRPRGIALPGPLQAELSPFVGRDAALERLRERFARAVDGERQVALLVGEPGIGKTRLAAELSREAHAEGAIVLYGRCDLESLVPYQPFVTAVQHYIAQRETLTLPRELEPELAELARFIPALRRGDGRDPIAEDGETRRFRLFEAVTRLLAHVAREAPVVLVLDDLQWADTSTALLLAHLLGDLEPARQFVLGTIRDADAHRSGELTELIGRLAREPQFERIVLTGLSGGETHALANAVGHDVSDSLVVRLRDTTDGNPFFIKETLRSIAEGSHAGVPEGVKDLIGTRLARLSDTANQLLSVASVIGREFDLEVLEALVPEPEDRIISALEEAGDAALIGEVEDAADRFVFSHALVRETLYERQSTTRRVRAHHRIARALEEVGRSAPAEIAHHYFESRHLDREGKAVGFSVLAGDAASRAFAYEDAATHYRHALERLPESDERRCALLLALGGAQSRGGDPEAAATFSQAAELAHERGMVAELAQAALGRTLGYAQAAALDTEGVALLEAALAVVTDDALSAQLHARLANVLHFTGQADLVETLSARALELAHRSGDPLALVSALEARQTVLVQSPDLAQRLELAREYLDLAAQLGDRELKAMALHWQIYHLLEAGDVDGARRESRVLRHLADELRQPTYLHFASRWETLWAMLADREEQAQELILRTYEIGRRAQAPEIDIEAAGRHLSLAWRHDALGPFAELLEAQARENPQLGTNLPVMALAFAQSGDLDGARAVLERIDIEALPRDMLWMASMAILAQACALVGDAGRARALYDILLPHRARNVMVGMANCMGSTERYLGLLATTLGDFPAAEVHFDTAIERNALGGLDHVFAMVRNDYAAMLELRNGPADALRAAQLRAETLQSTGAATQVAPPAPTQRA
jgi:tetratricopeptide (TPR) repeat protein